ncbi:MAG TPA: exodeoxyribonuclease VII large subunit, partial [Myxococcota bacterium]|nr:exodeoxyribonuclease VII large subunit [Myxococcota bacterium]
GREVARCRGVIWAQNLQQIRDNFRRLTNGGSLQSGLQVMLKGEAQLTERFGFQVVIQDIDPRYTLGEGERKVGEIRAQLQREGIYSKNRELPAPFDYHRVAVVAPPGAAGLGDFRAEAGRLEAAGVCFFDYFEAPFQGDQTRKLLPEKLRELHRQAHVLPGQKGGRSAPHYDAAVILRGGGSAVDLAMLNELEIAKAVCLLGIPVLVGVGHEHNRGILDEVAWRSLGTPSKVIAHIEETIVHNSRQLLETYQKIQNDAEARLLRWEQRLEREKQALVSASDRVLMEGERGVNEAFRAVVGFGPKATLERGYVLIRRPDGSVVSRAAALRPGQGLRLNFADGERNVRVEEE